MMEKPNKSEEIVGKIERAQEKAPQKEGGVAFAETWASPEEGAEELYALWRDYNRKKIGVYREAVKQVGGVKRNDRQDKERREALTKNVETDPRLRPLQGAMRTRFQDKQVRTVFERNLEKVIATEEELRQKKIEVGNGDEKREVPLWEHYFHQRKLKDEAEARRLELYSEIFSHREKDPDELMLLELADINTRIKVGERGMQNMEKESPELAARLSFERIKKYREELKKGGFIWTPSREEYFNKILEHLVIVNQNRPMLLYGETGTGKTRLAREVGKRLTGHAPYEVGEEAKTDIRPILGLRSIDKEGSYVTYGQLGQAVTGKKTSRDTKALPGGIFYMDEMNGYPPEGLRSLIKQLSGRRAGEEISFAAWSGHTEKLSPEFGFIGSANLPSEKHPDRADLPVEVARELSSLEVDYPPQTTDNPELYEMMLAALMDQNDRIRVPIDELAPEWKEVVDTSTATKRIELNTEPKSGGTLWRFANLVSEIQRSYKGEENVLSPTLRDASYLRHAVLDPGLVLSYLQEYRKSALRSHETLKKFLSKKINEWGSQKIYPEEDRNLIKKFQEEFQLT